MLHTNDLTVLIVDDNLPRASQLAHLVHLLGSMPLVAHTRATAERLVDTVDVLMVDDEALGGQGALIANAARSMPHLYRCLIADTSRIDDTRGVADATVAKPFTAITLGDVLAAAQRKRQWREAASMPALHP